MIFKTSDGHVLKVGDKIQGGPYLGTCIVIAVSKDEIQTRNVCMGEIQVHTEEGWYNEDADLLEAAA